ncbi:hypothetical protein [Parasphingorhabdus sp.]|uniref:hypothetical protein n=1 Tax=Parasphingorhabdus sp. TaxID=2709688 RepID=UPI003A8EA8A9
MQDNSNGNQTQEGQVDPVLFEFLSNGKSYGLPDHPVEIIESHMSLVFLVGDRAYKMKKPLRLDFLDNHDLPARLLNCQREFKLNRIFSPEIYLDLVPVTANARGDLELDGAGEPVEWLVVMRRLGEEKLLDHAIQARCVTPEHIAALAGLLGNLYRQTEKIPISGQEAIDNWLSLMDRNEQSLRAPEFGLDLTAVNRIATDLRRFLASNRNVIFDRVEQGWIRDGHGDLRPEHVYLGPPVRLIDRLEFDPQLRWHDPFEEVADLGLECERLGAPWIYPLLKEKLGDELGTPPSEALQNFYAGVHGCVRARLAIEHLRFDRQQSAKWLKRTEDCLRITAKYACS